MVHTLYSLALLFVIYCQLFSFNILCRTDDFYVHRQRKNKTRSAWVLISILSISLLLLTIFVALTLTSTFQLLLGVLVFSPDKPLRTRVSLASQMTKSANAYLSFVDSNNGLVFLLGDAIVIWRAWVVWGSMWQAKLTLVPLFLLFINFGLFVADQAIIHVVESYSNASDLLQSLISIFIISGYVLNIAVNLLATGLIMYRACIHSRMMSRAGSGRSQASRVLLLLTESGALYSCVQMVSLILLLSSLSPNADTSDLALAISLWQRFALFVSVTYPVLIVLIVAHNRSFAQDVSGLGTTLSEFGTDRDAKVDSDPEELVFVVRSP
jgi:hypothetical protein